MTIAAGFVCADGIVLCADTLISYPNNKRDGAKLWLIPPCGGALVAIAGAGDVALIGKTRDEIRRRLTASMDEQTIVEMIEDVIAEFIERYVAPYPDSVVLQILVGIRTANGCALYANSGGNHILGPVDSSECIGWGQSLGLYFAASLFRRGMPMKWTKTIAAHLLQQTKQYVPFCGGDSHILMMPRNGRAEFVNPADVSELEGHLSRITEAMQSVLVYAPDTSLSEATLTHRIAVLDAAVRAAREIIIDPVNVRTI